MHRYQVSAGSSPSRPRSPNRRCFRPCISCFIQSLFRVFYFSSLCFFSSPCMFFPFSFLCFMQLCFIILQRFLCPFLLFYCVATSIFRPSPSLFLLCASVPSLHRFVVFSPHCSSDFICCSALYLVIFLSLVFFSNFPLHLHSFP